MKLSQIYKHDNGEVIRFRDKYASHHSKKCTAGDIILHPEDKDRADAKELKKLIAESVQQGCHREIVGHMKTLFT